MSVDNQSKKCSRNSELFHGISTYNESFKLNLINLNFNKYSQKGFSVPIYK